MKGACMVTNVWKHSGRGNVATEKKKKTQEEEEENIWECYVAKRSQIVTAHLHIVLMRGKKKKKTIRHQANTSGSMGSSFSSL